MPAQIKIKDADGQFVPVEKSAALRNTAIHKTAKLMDEVQQFNREMNWKSWEIWDAFFQQMFDEYGINYFRDEKKKLTFVSFDEQYRVTLTYPNTLKWNEKLLIAQKKMQEVINANSQNQFLNSVFQEFLQTQQGGQVNKWLVLKLLRIDNADPRWQEAKTLLSEAQYAVSGARYVRCYQKNEQGKWVYINPNFTAQK